MIGNRRLRSASKSPVSNTGASNGVGATLRDQDLPELDEVFDDDQGPYNGRDEDENCGDDQVISQESFEEIQSRRA